ncbi:MAG: alcohol dehydrogenase, partial [Nitrospinota bacterium]
MRAVVFDQELSVREVPTPVPQPDEALIRVRLAGICNTDLEITRGYMGFRGILGHEFVGEVVECAASDWVGRRVVGEINCGCGRCTFCQAGLSRHCPHRSVLGILQRDGAFAEYLTLPIGNLHEVPASIPDQEAVFIEPLAAALEILDQVTITPQDRVLLVGDGKLALLIAQVVHTTGCTLCCVGKHPTKLRLLQPLGIETTLLSAYTPRQFDLVIEASGAPSGLEVALRSLRPRGTLVLKSTYAGEFRWNPAQLVIDEITLIGSR